MKNYGSTVLRFTFFAWVFLSHTAKAQIPSSLQLTSFDETNSGIKGAITCVLQAESGYIWLGSSYGLVRFDGYSFTSFPNTAARSSNITHIAEDKEHRIWMSFAGGEIASFDPKNGTFKNYTLHNTSDTSIGTSEIRCLFFDHNNQLWMGTFQKGLLRFDVSKNETSIYALKDVHHQFYPPAIQKIYNTVYDITEDQQHRLWLATHDGLYVFNNSMQLPKPVREKPVDPTAFRKDLFNYILAEGDSIWLASWGGGLSCYDSKTNSWSNYLHDPKHFGTGTTNIINGIAHKNSGELWVCSTDNGLGIFNKHSKSFFFFSTHPGYNIPAYEWDNLIVDREGILWSVHERGLMKTQIKEEKFYATEVPVTHTDNRSNYEIHDLWEDSTIQLIATSFADGVHVWNKKTGRRSILKPGLNSKEEPFIQVRQIFCDSRKQLWILTRDYFYKYDRKTNTLIKTVQPPLYSADSISNSFTSMSEDVSGNFWIGTKRNGVFAFNENTGQFIHFSTNDNTHHLPFNNVRDIKKDSRNRMWLAGTEGILGYVDPATMKFTNLPAGYGDGIKMPGNQGYSLFADEKGNMWTGTLSGLYYFDCSAALPKLLKVFRSTDGLNSDNVFFITKDKNGNVWCLSHSGLCLLPNGGLPISSFSTSDGIRYGGGVKILPTASDTMLLLNYGCYYRFVPSQFFASPQPHPLYITSMKVNDQPFYYEELLKNHHNIPLRSSQNFFSFEFASLNYTHPEKQQYAYMLEGFDKDWILAGSRRYVSYTNMPGGSYTFKVKTISQNKANETVISIPLVVATPYYRSYWFYVLMLVLIAFIMYMVYNARIQRHKRIHELETKAQILEKEKALVMYEGLKQQLNPHFLFNSLTSLNSLIVNDQKAAKDFLEQMSAIYRYILKSREYEMVLLSNEISFVSTYIQLQKTRFKDALQVTIDIDEEARSCKIVPVTLQNLVENAIKHNILDRETPLKIWVYSENDYLIVKNNLQKKKIVQTSNQQGLRNMKTLYGYLTSKPLVIEEDESYFSVKVPLV